MKWKLVPEELTQKQVNAACDFMTTPQTCDPIHGIYRAMLSAAPHPLHGRMTKEQIRQTAKDIIKEHGMNIVRELKKGDNYDGSNLAALLELFGERLLAIEPQ